MNIQKHDHQSVTTYPQVIVGVDCNLAVSCLFLSVFIRKHDQVYVEILSKIACLPTF